MSKLHIFKWVIYYGTEEVLASVSLAAIFVERKKRIYVEFLK